MSTETLKKTCAFAIFCLFFLSIPTWVATDACRKGRANSNRVFTAKIWLPKNAEVHTGTDGFEIGKWLENNGRDKALGAKNVPFYQYQKDFSKTDNRHLVMIAPGSIGIVTYRTIWSGKVYTTEKYVDEAPYFVEIMKTEYIPDGEIKYTTGEMRIFPIICITAIAGLGIDFLLAWAIVLLWMFAKSLTDKIRYRGLN
jgi:hypothetical protein